MRQLHLFNYFRLSKASRHSAQVESAIFYQASVYATLKTKFTCQIFDTKKCGMARSLPSDFCKNTTFNIVPKGHLRRRLGYFLRNNLWVEWLCFYR